jgi:peroxiredoxin Q/BCP
MPAPAPAAAHAGFPDIGQSAPDFEIPSNEGTIRLSDLRGKKVVLYFYPKDDTPGCTKEACGFNDALPDFSQLDAEIIGVSRDNLASHDRFRLKFGLKFRLGSDLDGKISKAYGTWVEKSMYGRTYMGMDRATFLIDRDGVIRGAWRNVKVPGHVEEVLAAARQI